MYLNASLRSPLIKWVACTLDGTDITSDCHSASEEKGIAICFRKRDGKRYVENGRVARELRRGVVAFSLREDAPDKACDYYQLKRNAEQKARSQ